MTVWAMSGGRKKFHRVRTTDGFCVPLARCAADVLGAPIPARYVPVEDRCQAPGCRTAWPAPLRAVG